MILTKIHYTRISLEYEPNQVYRYEFADTSLLVFYNYDGRDYTRSIRYDELSELIINYLINKKL